MKFWWPLFLAMKFTFLFLHLAKFTFLFLKVPILKITSFFYCFRKKMFLLPMSYVLPEEAFVLPDAIFNLVKMTSVFVKWSSWWLKSRQNVHLFRVRASSSRGPLSAINYRLDFPPHRITHEDRLSIQGKAEHWKKNIQRMLTWTSHAFTYMCVCVSCTSSGFSLFQEIVMLST